MNVKVFSLMSKVNEARFLVQHQSSKCKCRLDESVCNSKQKWNHDECRCEYKELDDWSSYKDDYRWNLITCDFECNKACKIDKYFYIKTCLCKKTSIR